MKIGVVLAVVPLFLALSLRGRQTNNESFEAVVDLSTNAPALSVNDTNSSGVTVGADEPNPAEFLNSTNAVPVAAPQPMAANVALSGGAVEVVKMAQSGVDEQVMLAFVTNYTSKFNLGSEEIIYLNDLGVSGNVVRSMIQRDTDLNTLIAQGQTTWTPQVVTNDYTTVNPTNLYYPPNYTEEPATPVDTAPNPDYANNNGVTYVGADDNYFDDSLQPYGSWVYVSGYGRCWQPTVCISNRDWRPYCDRGRWLYTDCGWYWQSDYSWGWAPFHYGRWFCDNNVGWVWCPGRTWGPAWVSWRNSSDYCGWAPLPPQARWVAGHGFYYGNRSVGFSFEFGLHANQYCFVPVERFCDYAPYRYRASSWQVEKFYHNTTVVNNFTFRDHKIVNQGIDPKHVAAVSHTQVPTATIKDMPAGHHGQPAHGEHWARNGGTIEVFRPQLPPKSGAKPTGGDVKAGGIVRGGFGAGHAASGSTAQQPPKPVMTPPKAWDVPNTVSAGHQPAAPAPTTPNAAFSAKPEIGHHGLPSRGPVPVVEKKDDPVPVAAATAGVKAPAPTASAPASPIYLRGATHNSHESVPPNSLVMIGRKDANNAVPSTTRPSLPNMNLANQAANNAANSPTPTWHQPNSSYQPNPAGNYYNPGSRFSGSTTPITANTGPAQNAAAQQNLAGQQWRNQFGSLPQSTRPAPVTAQDFSKPSAPAFGKPYTAEHVAPGAPQWTAPTHPSVGGSGGNYNYSRNGSAAAASTYHATPSVPTARSVPAESHSAPSFHSSPAPSYSAPAQHSAPASSGSSSSSSGRSKP